MWHQRVELVNVGYKLQSQRSKSSFFFFFFCLFWTNQEFQSAASVLSSVDQIHFLIDFTFLLRHGNQSPTHAAFLSVMIFGGFFFFLLSLFYLCAVDVFEREREKKSDPAKIMCYCDNFPTVCELDMDLYFRQP